MHVDMKPLKAVMIITDRDKGKKVSQVLNKNNFSLHSGFLGKGTAPSEISTLLGVGEVEKAIILLIISEEKVETLFNILKEELHIGQGGGIAFTIPLNSVSNMKVVKFITGLN